VVAVLVTCLHARRHHPQHEAEGTRGDVAPGTGTCAHAVAAVGNARRASVAAARGRIQRHARVTALPPLLLLLLLEVKLRRRRG
jgi:hypothetical protein